MASPGEDGIQPASQVPRFPLFLRHRSHPSGLCYEVLGQASFFGLVPCRSGFTLPNSNCARTIQRFALHLAKSTPITANVLFSLYAVDRFHHAVSSDRLQCATVTEHDARSHILLPTRPTTHSWPRLDVMGHGRHGSCPTTQIPRCFWPKLCRRSEAACSQFSGNELNRRDRLFSPACQA